MSIDKAKQAVIDAVTLAIDRGSIDFCTSREVYYAHARLREEQTKLLWLPVHPAHFSTGTTNEPDLTEYAIIGRKVLPGSPYTKGHEPGVIVGTHLMVSASGLKRRKWSVEYKHNRTKNRTATMTLEANDFTLLPEDQS